MISGQMFVLLLKKRKKIPLNTIISKTNYVGMLAILLHEWATNSRAKPGLPL